MTKLKRVAACSVAVAMCCSLSVFAACGDGDDSTIVGKGGYTPSSQALEVVDAWREQSNPSIEVQVSEKIVYNSESQLINANTDEPYDEFKDSEVSTRVANMSAKVNLNSGDGDFFGSFMESYEKSGDDIFDLLGQTTVSGETEEYRYAFLRNWHQFSQLPAADGEKTETTKITDFSDVTFEYDGYIFEAAGEELNNNIPFFNFESFDFESFYSGMYSKILGYMFAPVLYIADAYGAVTYGASEITLDANKLLYGIYSDLYSLVSNIKQTNTLKDVLQNDCIATVIQAFTYGIDVKEVYDSLYAFASASEDYADVASYIFAILPVPAAGETVYSYLIKLLSDSSLSQLVMPILSQYLPGNATLIADITVNDIFNLVLVANEGGYPFSDIKAVILKYLDDAIDISATSASFRTEEIGDIELFSCSGIKLVFQISSDNKCTGMSFTADVTWTGESTRSVSAELNQNKSEKAVINISYSVSFSDKEFVLTNIDDNDAVQYIEVFEDASQEVSLGMVPIENYEQEIIGYNNYYAVVYLNDSAISGIEIYKVVGTLNEDGTYVEGEPVQLECSISDDYAYLSFSDGTLSVTYMLKIYGSSYLWVDFYLYSVDFETGTYHFDNCDAYFLAKSVEVVKKVSAFVGNN